MSYEEKNSVYEMNCSHAQGADGKKTDSSRPMKEENGEEFVSTLEESAARGDVNAMLKLAKCCALGNGIKRDGERAEALLSECAKKGNQDAQSLMAHVNETKRGGNSGQRFSLYGLYDTSVFIDSAFCFHQGFFQGMSVLLVQWNGSRL